METPLHLWNALLGWLDTGLVSASGWQIALYALITTHVTIASVTIYLHRCQAHRSLELHPAVSHFFRAWLWMSTAMHTKGWVATHRKHHAKCDTAEDPHSPQTRGIGEVLRRGAELYRVEAENPQTMAKYGRGTPDDWIERHVYSRYTILGVTLMAVLNLALFGAAGLTVWAIQMIWIPVTAAGIINGLGHWWGYRNFESEDASTNLSPWGILIGGEELHNNHHTYPTSAKLSVKPHEFDIGWAYIRTLEMAGLATVRKVPPRMIARAAKPIADLPADVQTLHAVISHRYELMARYATVMRHEIAMEMGRRNTLLMGAPGGTQDLKLAYRWLPRDESKVPPSKKAELQHVVQAHPRLARLVTLREDLRSLWSRTNVSVDQLVLDLQAWCKAAESHSVALRDLVHTIRLAQLAPGPA